MIARSWTITSLRDARAEITQPRLPSCGSISFVMPGNAVKLRKPRKLVCVAHPTLTLPQMGSQVGRDFHLEELTMRALAVVIGGTALILLASAVLAPWLYWLAQAFPAVLPAKAVHGPFHQYIIRSMPICAVLGLFIIRYLAFNSWQQLGLRPPRRHWREFVAGFCWTFLLLSVLAAIVVGRRRARAERGIPAPGNCWRAGDGRGNRAHRGLPRGALVPRRLVRRAAAGLVHARRLAGEQHDLRHFALSAPGRKFSPRRPGTRAFWCCRRRCADSSICRQHIMPGFLFLTAAGMIFGLAYYRQPRGALRLHWGCMPAPSW